MTTDITNEMVDGPTSRTEEGTVKEKKQNGNRKKRNNGNRKSLKRNKNKGKNGFTGKTDEMKGHVFQLKTESRSVLEFTKTQEQLVRYATSTYKRSEEIKWMIKHLEEKKFEEPEEPVEIKNDKVREKVFDKMINNFLARKSNYEEAKSKLWEVIWYQCSKALQTKIIGQISYKSMMEKNDCVNLLKMIKRFMFTDENTDYEPMTIYQAKLNALLCRQGRTETVYNYYTRQKGLLEVLEYHKCSIGGDDIGMIHFEMRENGVMIDPDSHIPGDSEYEEFREAAIERFWAAVLITNADSYRFGILKNELANAYAKGKSEYPTTIIGAYELLLKYNKNGYNENHSLSTKATEEVTDDSESEDQQQDTENFVKSMAFANVGKDKKIKCFKCGEEGHIATYCPNEKKKEITCTTYAIKQENNIEDETDEEDEFGDLGYCLSTISKEQPLTTTQQIVLANKELVNGNWILLDTQSTVHIFKSKHLLENVRKTKNGIRCYCNGGYQDTSEQGEMKGVGKVYYNPSSLANILSFSIMSNRYRITCDTSKENSFTIHDINGKNMKFICSQEGLYYHDIKYRNNEYNKTEKQSYNPIIMLNTIKGNQEGFTRRELKNVEIAKRAHILLGRPNYRDFMNIVKWNMLKNCPITHQDVINTWKIYGPDIGSVRGKTTRKNSKPVNESEIIPIPQELLYTIQNITLCIDVMFVDKLVIMTTISRKIAFTTIDILKNQKAKELLKAIKRVIALYETRQIIIEYILSDRQFLCLQDELLQDHNIKLNVCGTNEHVGDIERNIRVLKERVRAVMATLPFTIIPKIMKIALLKLSAFWINLFPRKGSISRVYSPRLLLLGEVADFNKICKIPFGAYCEIHEQPTQYNGIDPRSSPAIALCPENNIQNTYYFMSLRTFEVVSRKEGDFTEVPMPESVIRKVEDKGREDANIEKGVPIPEQYIFKYVDGTELDEDNDNEIQNQGGEDQERTTHENEERIEIDMNEEIDTLENAQYNPDTGQRIPEESIGSNENDDDESLSDESRNSDREMIIEDIENNEDEEKENQIVKREEEEIKTDENYRFKYGMEMGDNPKEEDCKEEEKNALIANRMIKDLENEYLREYVMYTSHIPKGNKTCYQPGDGFGNKYGYAAHMMLVQMSAKQGIKKFGIRAEKAIESEFEQLVHGKEVFIPKFFKELTREQRRKALRAITLLDLKRSGKLKGRTVANGSVQRQYIPQDEASSPTVATESVFITAVVNAMENRVIAVCDVSGAFLQAYMTEFVVVVFEEEMVDIMIRIEPKYREYVHITKDGKKRLYMQLRKAMYGCLKAARLWWEEFSKYLTETLGFELNPYDNCVANKTIEGSQCTVIWHVDDLKISHKKKHVVEDVIKQIEMKFEKMSVNIGKNHTYLGIDFEYKNNGTVSASMISYLKEAIADYPDELPTRIKTPASPQIFEVDEDGERLNEERAKVFHSIVAKLLFISKRTRPDIQVAVSFLSTRTTKSDIHDWKKLGRLLGYINNTINLKLVLSCSTGIPIIKWWVDASYGVHIDMKSHTGAMMSLGGGCLYSKSVKQKVNAKSSTEAELIAASDMNGQILWTLYFIQAQGYDVKENIVYQDNQSAILLEKNGQLSSSQRTRHIKVRYFFIKDKIADGEMQVVYCPSGDMLGDFFTKPLQGEKFIKFRRLILGEQDVSTKEGVGTDINDVSKGNSTHLEKDSEF